MIVVALLVGTGWIAARGLGVGAPNTSGCCPSVPFGLLLFVAGLVGWDLSYSRGWFQGTKWVDGPTWWQVALGTALLLLAALFARRLPHRQTP
jgi:hypothetical protein